jgi:hypothetical protein
MNYSQAAFNYATESENRMHADSEARAFGFRGGLVPGIADYAFFVPPIVEVLGDGWAKCGWMSVKLLAPVYDGDRIEVTGSAEDGPPRVLTLELRGSGGELCAVATAGVEGGPRLFDRDLESGSLPSIEERPDASLQVLSAGCVLGSLEMKLDQSSFVKEWQEHFGAAGEWPVSAQAPHPAFYPDLGNRILSSNVLLGPWIHTESRTRHLDGVRWGEPITVRGAVRAAFEKRGHEIVYLDVGFYGDDGRALALLDHRAIIRPRTVQATTP